MHRKVAQAVRICGRPRRQRALQSPRCPSNRSRAYGTARPRESMKAQSLACNASSSRTAAGPAAVPAATTCSSAARVANASSATRGPDQVDRSPSRPQLLACPRLGVAEWSRLQPLQRVVEAHQLEPLPRALLHDRLQPRDPLVPPVAEQLGIQRAHRQPAPGQAGAVAAQTLAGAGHEVRGVLPGERDRPLVVVCLAVVAPRGVVVDGVVVVVAIGAVRPGSRRRSRRARIVARSIGTSVTPSSPHERPQVLARAQPEAVGQLDAGGMHPCVRQRRGQPRRVRALRQPEAAPASPRLAEAGAVGRRRRSGPARACRRRWRAAAARRAWPRRSTGHMGRAPPAGPRRSAAKRSSARS